MALQNINKKKLLIVVVVVIVVLAVALFFILQASAATFSVSTNTDDGAQQENGIYVNNATNTNIGCRAATKSLAGTRIHGAFRFQSVSIDQGAIVESATLKIRTGASAEGLYPFHVYGNDADTALSFGSEPPIGMPTTTAVTIWEGADNENKASIDVSTVVQEILNRPGWTSGNHMKFGVYALTACSADRYTNVFFRDNSVADAAELEILLPENPATVLKIKGEVLKIKSSILKIK